jgi:hypothetical protein
VSETSVSPPKPWFDINRQFADIDASSGGRWFSAAWLRWAALAASGIGVWALVQQFRPAEVKTVPEAPIVRPQVVSRPQEHPVAPSQTTPPRMQPASPSEELQVFAALRRLDADLGDPIDVTRNETNIVVSGIGIDADLERKIQEELRGMPRVEVHFSDPPADVQQPVEGSTAAVSADGASLQLKLEQQLGGRAAFDQLADEVLGILEMVMSRSHAIRRLAERFPSGLEARLPEKDRRLLTSLRREHAVALTAHAAAVQQRMTPLLLTLGATRSSGSHTKSIAWQSDAADLLKEARQLESALAVMLGGASSDRSIEALPSDALRSINAVRERAEWHVKDTGEVR